MFKVLFIYLKTRGLFHCVFYVGLSNSVNRKQSIDELFDIHAQREILTDFRDDRKNLIIATDVREEGINITVYHLVIYFDSPPNLKSFI